MFRYHPSTVAHPMIRTSARPPLLAFTFGLASIFCATSSSRAVGRSPSTEPPFSGTAPVRSESTWVTPAMVTSYGVGRSKISLGRSLSSKNRHACSGLRCEVRLYDRSSPFPPGKPYREGHEFTSALNPESLLVVRQAKIEPSVAQNPPGTRYQFGRTGYFISDPLTRSRLWSTIARVSSGIVWRKLELRSLVLGGGN